MSTNSGVIRKIIIGEDPKNAMAYYLGMRAGGGQITAIMFDEPYLYKHGKERFLIYIDIEGEGTILWKWVLDMRCLVEFDCRFE